MNARRAMRHRKGPGGGEALCPLMWPSRGSLGGASSRISPFRTGNHGIAWDFMGVNGSERFYEGKEWGIVVSRQQKAALRKIGSLKTWGAGAILRKNEKRRDGGRFMPAARWDAAENCFLPASYRWGEALPQAAMNALRLNCVKGHEDVTMNWTPSVQDPHIRC